jgi:hypothetical protein
MCLPEDLSGELSQRCSLQQARKKVREYQAKKMLKAEFAKLLSVDLPIYVAQVRRAYRYGCC